VVPSIIDTPANRSAMPNANTGSWLQPDEIAEVVAFLAGDTAQIVTGSAISLSRV
jgi:NAD(P)-dependent dehydrogenase (short-subunit alcohol dehydrogenase family)